MIQLCSKASSIKVLWLREPSPTRRVAKMCANSPAHSTQMECGQTVYLRKAPQSMLVSSLTSKWMAKSSMWSGATVVFATRAQLSPTNSKARERCSSAQETLEKLKVYGNRINLLNVQDWLWKMVPALTTMITKKASWQATDRLLSARLDMKQCGTKKEKCKEMEKSTTMKQVISFSKVALITICVTAKANISGQIIKENTLVTM